MIGQADRRLVRSAGLLRVLRSIPIYVPERLVARVAAVLLQ